MRTTLVIAAAGALGAASRHLLESFVNRHWGDAFPWGTFVVNVSGAFVLGLLAGLALHGDALLLTGTATLGSFTTFSTWMLETQRLVEDGAARVAALNVVLSLAAGLAAVALGRALG